MIEGSKYFKKELEANGFDVRDHSRIDEDGDVYYWFSIYKKGTNDYREHYEIKADSHFVVRESVKSIIEDYNKVNS